MQDRATKVGGIFFYAQDYKFFDKRHRGCNEALVSGVHGFNARGFVTTDTVRHKPIMIEDDKRQAGTGLAEFRKDGTATFGLTGVKESEILSVGDGFLEEFDGKRLFDR